jgi:hypothetical protein
LNTTSSQKPDWERGNIDLEEKRRSTQLARGETTVHETNCPLDIVSQRAIVCFIVRMEGTEDLAKTEEENNDAVLETSGSWTDDPLQDADSQVPDVFSPPETAPSVTPSRKNELLLEARADRIAWIQKAPLPYQTFKTIRPAAADDPWGQDDRLVLLRDVNAVQSLPSIPNVLSSLYGEEESTPAHVTTRIQALVCFSLSVYLVTCVRAILICFPIPL